MSDHLQRKAAPVVAIIGATRGLGLELTRAFAAEGAQLVLTGRVPGALQEAVDLCENTPGKGPSPIAALVDFNKADGIDHLAHEIYQQLGHVDVLISTVAQASPLMPVAHIAPKDWEQMLIVNLTGHYRLIRAFEPLLRQSQAGRAIFTTCSPDDLPSAFCASYAASKAGLTALTLAWAAELQNTSIKVNLVNPGPMATRLRQLAYPGRPASQWPNPAEAVPTYTELAHPACQKHGEIILTNPSACAK